MSNKYYVVWQGRRTGIFTDWNTCKQQVDQFAGAKYKSFTSLAEAEAAYRGKPLMQPNGFEEFTLTNRPTAKKSSSVNAVKTYSVSEIAALQIATKIFTDGGCEPNPGKAGSGLAVYRDGSLQELWYGLYNPQGTNNTAELNALFQGLIMAQGEVNQGRSVAIFCDSKYAIQCITHWAAGWEKKGWKKPGGEIKNLELIKAMFALYQTLKNKIQVLHVNGHVGVEGNELADRMSILAIESRHTGFSRYTEPMDIRTLLAARSG